MIDSMKTIKNTTKLNYLEKDSKQSSTLSSWHSCCDKLDTLSACNLNTSAISKEAVRFGYKLATVTNLHTILTKTLSDLSESLREKNNQNDLSISLEFTNNKISAYIVGDNNTLKFLTKPETDLYVPVKIAKTNEFEMSITKIGKAEDPQCVDAKDKDISNILSIDIKAEQKHPAKKICKTRWKISEGKIIQK